MWVIYSAYLSSPLTMMPTREQSASASSMECVVSMAERRPWKLARIVSQRKRLLRGSMPVLGSSSSTTFGPPTIAIANDSLRRVPPLHCCVCFAACSFICSPDRYMSTTLQPTRVTRNPHSPNNHSICFFNSFIF